ncbi:YczE/YyaS/YitT family protein [Lacrimispora sp.]|uniref:YczE/YyaS/YitT family protein n=1 Tax=Lacrimispora sp. TaxID=2719234 RepID=UPI002FD9D153
MRKIIVLIAGILLMALGTAVCNNTALGIDPFNAFCADLSAIANIQLGTMILLVQLAIAILVFFLNKKYLGIGSVIPMVMFGYFLQFFNWAVFQLITFDFVLIIRFFIFFIGMLIIAFGMSIYMSCDLGMVPYDCFSFIMSERLGRNAFKLRVVLDTMVAVIAILLKGPINIGTILLAFCVGPLIGFFKKRIVSKLLLHI